MNTFEYLVGINRLTSLCDLHEICCEIAKLDIRNRAEWEARIAEEIRIKA